MNKFTVVSTFADEIEARLAQATLAAAEIESFIKVDDAGGMLDSLQFVKGVKLLVEEPFLEEARILLSSSATEEIE